MQKIQYQTGICRYLIVLRTSFMLEMKIQLPRFIVLDAGLRSSYLRYRPLKRLNVILEIEEGHNGVKKT